MSLKKRDVCVEVERLFGVKDGDGRSALPRKSDHLSIEGDAILVRGVGTVNSCEGDCRLKVQVSERVYCFGFYHFGDFCRYVY